MATFSVVVFPVVTTTLFTTWVANPVSEKVSEYDPTATLVNE